MTTAEDLEKEAAELEARAAAVQAKVRAKRVATHKAKQGEKAKESGPLEKIIRNNTAASSHGGYAGRTLIQRIESQADRCHRKADRSTKVDEWWHRLEGLCAALAILRSSSMEFEIQRSGERLDGAG